MTRGLRTLGHRLLGGLSLAACWTQAQATSIPFKPERAEGPGADTWAGALLASVLALAALLYLAHRYWSAAGGLKNRLAMTVSAPVRVVGSTRLNAQVQLTVVEFERKKLLLAVTSTSVTVLERTDIAAPTEGAP